MRIRNNLYSKLLLAVAMSFCLYACSSSVKTDTTTFYILGYQSSGGLIVVSGDELKANTLEFANYKRKIEDQFSKQGYTITQTPDEANFVAFVTYGIDDGSDRITNTSAGGFVTNFGGYTMPIYLSGSNANYETIYTKVIAIDVVKIESLKTDKPVRVYEIRGRSIGEHSHINCVFKPMLQSMFKRFPGEDGKTETINWYRPEC